MSKFRFKIDEKSLYYWIKNDYLKWQTATVNTPINQARNPNNRHRDIMELYDSWMELKQIPDVLKDKCLKTTTSQANSIINYFFEFRNLYIDWVKLNTKSSFWIYIKEEVDKYIKDRKRRLVSNTHLWRKKLHYPISLKHMSDWLNINNKDVLNCILVQNWWFAYIVRWFECDTVEKSLNFITSIIWLEWILLSNVFRRQKWVWKKLLISEINPDDINLEAQDILDEEKVVMSEDFKPWNNINFEKINKLKVENGKIGEKYVYDNIRSLISNDIQDIYHTSEFYPTSPYDIEYVDNWVKKYLEVKSTSGIKEVFNMSCWEIKFMKKYKNDYTLILVTDVKNKFPTIRKFICNEILNLKQEYPSTRFYAN